MDGRGRFLQQLPRQGNIFDWYVRCLHRVTTFVVLEPVQLSGWCTQVQQTLVYTTLGRLTTILVGQLSSGVGHLIGWLVCCLRSYKPKIHQLLEISVTFRSKLCSLVLQKITQSFTGSPKVGNFNYSNQYLKPRIHLTNVSHSFAFVRIAGSFH